MIDYLTNVVPNLYYEYGNMDNFIVIIGAGLGANFDKFFVPSFLRNGISRHTKVCGACVGGGLFNAISDFAGGMYAGDMELAIGTALGCLQVMILIPVIILLKQHLGKIKKFTSNIMRKYLTS